MEVSLYKRIMEIKNISSTKEKRQYIKSIDSEELRYLFIYAYNPYYRYGIKNIQDRIPKTSIKFKEDSGKNYDKLFNILDLLRDKKLSGNAALDYIRTVCEQNNYEFYKLLVRILNRDLDCGIGIETINACFSGLIPTMKVMLAKTGEPFFPAIVEEKYDGVRFICFVTDGVCQFVTRNGHIADFKNLARHITRLGVKNCVLDGEITGVDRQSVSGLVNKYLLGTEEGFEDEEFVYNIFDILSHDDWNKQTSKPLHIRKKQLEKVFEKNQSTHLKYAISFLCENKELFDRFYATIVDNGGEGVVLKGVNSPYELKRSHYWLKFKEEKLCDLLVVKTLEGTGKREDLGSLLCQSACGKLTVRVGSGLTEKDIVDMLEENPTGKIVEVRYNSKIMDKQNDYSLFLPRFVRLREDKDIADKLEEIE